MSEQSDLRRLQQFGIVSREHGIKKLDLHFAQLRGAVLANVRKAELQRENSPLVPIAEKVITAPDATRYIPEGRLTWGDFYTVAKTVNGFNPPKNQLPYTQSFDRFADEMEGTRSPDDNIVTPDSVYHHPQSGLQTIRMGYVTVGVERIATDPEETSFGHQFAVLPDSGLPMVDTIVEEMNNKLAAAGVPMWH